MILAYLAKNARRNGRQQDDQLCENHRLGANVDNRKICEYLYTIALPWMRIQTEAQRKCHMFFYCSSRPQFPTGKFALQRIHYKLVSPFYTKEVCPYNIIWGKEG